MKVIGLTDILKNNSIHRSFHLQGRSILLDRVRSVPDSCVMVSSFRANDCGHNGCNVEIWPFEHDFMEKGLLSESFAAELLQLVLSWDTSGIVDGLGEVSVVVSLNQKPSGIGKCVSSVGLVCISLENGTLVALSSSNDVVDWPSNNLSLHPLDSCSISSLILKNSPHEPDSGIGLLGKYTDQILAEILGLSCINIERKGSMSYSSQCKDASSDSINAEDAFTAIVVLNINDKFGEEFPHLEIQISAMQDLTLIIAHDDSSAGLEGGEFVHEVQEEEFVEGQAAELGNCVDLGNEILMFELIFGEPFNTVEESFGDREQIKEFQESSERLFEVSDDGSPSNFGTVRQLHLVGERNVAFHWAGAWDDG